MEIIFYSIIFCMNDIRRNKAIALRSKGWSINEIATELHAAKSSVSLWMRNVSLSDSQQLDLSLRAHTAEAIERRRTSRLLNEGRKRDEITSLAYKAVGSLSARELWLIGTALYWAEGGKTKRMVRFSNGDPEMIKLMMRFFRETCHVPDEKFRGYIHIHESLDTIAAEKYWSGISDISLSHFYKTYNKPNISSKGLRQTLPYGVFDIYITNAKLFLQIEGWTKALYGGLPLLKQERKPLVLVGDEGLEPPTL